MRTRIIGAVLCLVLAGGGATACCGAEVKDGDRQLFDQSHKAAEAGLSALATGDGRAALQPLADIRDNEAQLIKNFGPPEKPVPYSPKGSSDARDQSAAEHKKSIMDWVIQIGGYISGAALIAAALLNAPVIGPFLATTRLGQIAARALGGKIVKVGLDGLKTISTLRSEAEEAPLTPQRVVELAVKTFSPQSAAIADKVSNQIEKANNIEVTPIKDLEAPQPPG